jgi:hypothetical protein
MALSPRQQLLAAGTAARPHAPGDARIDILGLWEMDDESERCRQLEVVATIPAPATAPSTGWRGRRATPVYPYGLLAGALDDVWDPNKLD